MKFLIVGLGNIGDEYAGTRHNIGFMMIDAFAASVNAHWEDKRYGFVAKCRVKSAEMVLLKPSTYMNISGNGPKALRDISLVGNDLLMDHSASMCGKGGQNVPVSQGLPTVLINKLTVG